jgi:integrase
MQNNSNEKQTNKGGRKPTGTIQKTKDGRWRARVTLSDGSRKWLPPFPVGTSEEMARERARALTEKAFREGLKSTTPPNKRDRAKLAAEAKESCVAWVKLWQQERDDRGLSSSVTKQGHWKLHIAPVLSGKHPKVWTREDFRKLSVALDAKVRANEIAWKSAQDIWGTATKMADDACNSKLPTIRCRDDNPATDVRGPDRGAVVARQYLYPNEVEQLLACEVVPLHWRRLFAVAVYTYCRAAELRALTWADVDLAHGVIHITKSARPGTDEIKTTKSKKARRIPIELGLRPLLVAMHAAADGKGPVLTEIPSEFNLSAGLKRWLKAAKVDRASLTAKGPSERPIRFHDLRATGITWMAVRGDDATKIQARAGHSSFATTQGYIREAEIHRDGFGEPFGALPLSVLPTNCLNRAKTSAKVASPTRFELVLQP